MIDRALSRDEIRSVDRRAIEEFGVPGVVLMENAGRGTAETLIELGIEGPVVICAGKGNNAGDGFVVARHLENRGCEVRVLLFSRPEQLKGDAEINYRIIAAAGTPIRVFDDEFDSAELDRELQRADWIVDALLGTGTRGEIREPFATVIERINAARERSPHAPRGDLRHAERGVYGRAKVLAVDLPSGMDCDTGESLGVCVRADHTATFLARKLGFDAPGPGELIGEVHVIDIGVPRAAIP